MNALTLTGRFVRLEPLGAQHIEGLAAASATENLLYQWSVVPQGTEAVKKYIETATALRDAGTTLPFATVRVADGVVVGSTRFFDIERWPWTQGHPRHGRTDPDVCEIGYTWLAPTAIRTGVNTEAKLLMLTHAFEQWKVVRVCLHTDARNQRSRAAMERIGCQFEGILHSHRMATDFTPRDSARYAIVAADWPDVKQRITELLDRR